MDWILMDQVPLCKQGYILGHFHTCTFFIWSNCTLVCFNPWCVLFVQLWIQLSHLSADQNNLNKTLVKRCSWFSPKWAKALPWTNLTIRCTNVWMSPVAKMNKVYCSDNYYSYEQMPLLQNDPPPPKQVWLVCKEDVHTRFVVLLGTLGFFHCVKTNQALQV